MSESLMEPWVTLWGVDPRPYLLASEEATARWVTMTALLDRAHEDPQVRAERAAVLSSPMVSELIARLPRWGEASAASGHHSPAYLPNQLHLLADMGVRGGDDDRLEQTLDDICANQYDDGRFPSFGRAPTQPEPLWGSLPCDTHIITEVLIRYGRRDHPATSRGLERIAADLQPTNQGLAWTCIPDPGVGFRGPGRKGDVCPQVTLEALRTFARLPPKERPEGLGDAAATLLSVWRNRGFEQPYMFGHGYRFKTVKWPPLWYGAYWMLDTLGRYPSLWRDGSAMTKQSIAELAACLVAYNVSPGGTVTPRSVYRGFERFSYGQKKRASPFATALLASVVRRLSDLADEAIKVDVRHLPSSKGGTGTPATTLTPCGCGRIAGYLFACQKIGTSLEPDWRNQGCTRLMYGSTTTKSANPTSRISISSLNPKTSPHRQNRSTSRHSLKPPTASGWAPRLAGAAIRARLNGAAWDHHEPEVAATDRPGHDPRQP